MPNEAFTSDDPAAKHAAPDDTARHLRGRTLILLSNREPYEHVLASPAGEDGGEAGEVTVRRPAGGLVSALDPTMQRTHGVWVAWGSGSGDRAATNADDRVAVPPDNPSYTVRRVWLDDADVDGYYLGFANSALWPLCHMLIQHFQFRSEHWERYEAVNARFAAAVADEARRSEGRPVVWVQDYHFALVAKQLRDSFALDGGDVPFIHQFWHIPFPPADILRLLPHGVCPALLEGLLGNDLLEFHTERYAQNFLACVADFVPGATVDFDARRVTVDGRTTEVAAYPISIDVGAYEEKARAAEPRARELRERHAQPSKAGECQLGVSVDRVDYTKGIPERLRALDFLWSEFPELRERLTFIFVATPSRSELAAYRDLSDEVAATVDDINRRFGTPSWRPIIFHHENVDAEELAAFYRAADLCLVSSLQDGMNLVAKEFVACQADERGVLVLSRFAGAAEEIEGAVLINPFNTDGFANGIRAALAMPAEERQRRMRGMRARLRETTIFDWLEDILSHATALMDAKASAATAAAAAATGSPAAAGVAAAAPLPGPPPSSPAAGAPHDSLAAPAAG
jgi:trehalose 6-phosphate synthase